MFEKSPFSQRTINHKNFCISEEMGKDFYKILEISRDADSDTIRRAYKKQAMKWHPDKNPNNIEEAQARFQEIAEAYEVLSDPEKKQLYDLYGEEGLAAGGNPNSSHSSNYSRGYSFNPNHAEQIFRTFFGGGNRGFGGMFGGGVFDNFFDDDDGFFSFGSRREYNRPRSRRMDPAVYSVKLTLEQLFTGVKKEIKIKRTINGVRNKCYLELDVAPGTVNGTKYTYQGEGDQEPGYEPQDVVIIIEEIPHPIFKREKNNLVYYLTISLKQSICGIALKIKGVDGTKIPLVINSYIPDQETRVIQGQGMPDRRGGRGDLYVVFKVQYPQTPLSDEAREMIEQILPD